MPLNVQNLNKLIGHLEAQPPERFNMAFVFTGLDGDCSFVVPSLNECGTAACIAGHCAYIAGVPIGGEYDSDNARDWLGLTIMAEQRLFMPPFYAVGLERYPLTRAISTLKRLRDRFLATGEIVVDWGPEPTAGEPWAAPKAVELTPPALPDEITRLLAPASISAEA